MISLLQFEQPLIVIGRIIGLGLLSGVVAASAALFYRWYAREQIPRTLAILLGLGAIAISLNSLVALSQYIDPIDASLTPMAALVDGAAFVAGAVLAESGRHIGDRLALSWSAIIGARELDSDLGELNTFVRSVGRVIPVTVPDQIDDIVGYDPLLDSTKETLTGRTLLFPRGLTVAELRERFIDRLREDYDVGNVDVEFSSDGMIEYLALGGRVTGIGPTIPPRTVVIGLKADPAPDASTGDAVQLWRPEGDKPTRIARCELRGTAGDVVTLAIDSTDLDKIDRSVPHRLVTLAVDKRADREFATMLRTADETMGVFTIEPSSSLEGSTIGTLNVTIVAVEAPDGSVEAIPSKGYELAAGDTVYAVALPERLRNIASRSRAS